MYLPFWLGSFRHTWVSSGEGGRDRSARQSARIVERLEEMEMFSGVQSSQAPC